MCGQNEMIYLDHSAGTPVHPQVAKAMWPYLTDRFGNASSIHQWGRQSRQAVEKAREQVALALGCDASQIIFTSGGTEADNLAISGGAYAGLAEGRNHVITSEIEHNAVFQACRALEKYGFRVTYLPVDTQGRVSIMDCEKAIGPDTSLISVMYGNNEIGTLQPVDELGKLAHQHGILFHTDAVQAFATEMIEVERMPVDMLSLSAHKIGGPQGVGCLYVASNVVIQPHMHGGSQEKNLRAGTENVAGIVGFGKAAEIVRKNRKKHRWHMKELRKSFLNELARHQVSFVINGDPYDSLPHILNISFPGVKTETLLIHLDMAGIACSGGATCIAGVAGSSRILKAMQLSENRISSALRISFGYGNTVDEVKWAAKKIAEIAPGRIS